MNRLKRCMFAAGAALGLLAGSVTAAQAEDARKLAHAQGAGLPAVPAKVAVLGLAALDTLDALGIAPAAVPALPAGESTVRWPAHLLARYADERYLQLPGVARDGSNADQQIARIKTLGPDLIVVDGRSSGPVDALKGVAPILDLSVSNASFVASVAQGILSVGAAFDRERETSARLHALLGEIRTLHEQAAEQGTGLVMFAAGSRVMPQQLDARFGMLYQVVGIRPVLRPDEGQGLSTGRPQAAAATDDSPEAKAAADAAQKARQAAEERYLSEVMAREPDWLFVVDRNAAFGDAKAAAAMAATPAIAGSKAWREGKVVFLDQDGASWYLMAGGLGLLEKSVRQLKDAFDAGKGMRTRQ